MTLDEALAYLGPDKAAEVLARIKPAPLSSERIDELVAIAADIDSYAAVSDAA